MASQHSKKVLKENYSRQQQLVQLKKMQQGAIDVPEYVSPDTQPKTFKDKTKNFWYYYKIYIIVGILLCACLAVLIKQCAEKETYDYQILFYCSKELSDTQTNQIADNFKKFATDVDGDGKVNILTINCSGSESSNYDTRTVSSTRLQTSLTNEDILLYVTDDEKFDSLQSISDDGIPFFYDIGLQENEGMALPLDKKYYTGDGENIIFPKNLSLKISVRNVNGTILEKKKNVKTIFNNSKKLILNIQNNKPAPKGVKK